MSRRYLKLSRHHFLTGAAATLAAVLTASACLVNALADRPVWSIAGGCATALFAFICTLEFCEAARCLRIAARWNQWDRRDLPPLETR